MPIKIVRDPITRGEVEKVAKEFYEDLLKGVADIHRGILALGGEMHADAEKVLLEDGSEQKNLWGFNILLDKKKEESLVYESFINIRPRDNNKSLEVQSPEIRDQIQKIVFEKITL